MTVSVRAGSAAVHSSATSAATRTVTPTLPTGTAIGDRVYIWCASDSTTAAHVTTPTGWTKVGADTQFGGTTTPGAAAGYRRGTVFYRDRDTTWTMPTVSFTSSTQATVSAVTLVKTAGTWDAPTSTTGTDTTSATSYSAVGAGSIPFDATESEVLLFNVLNSTSTVTTNTITATNTTFAALTTPVAISSNTTGNDIQVAVYAADVSIGATAAPTHTMTLGSARMGGTFFVQQTATVPAGAKIGTLVDDFATLDSKWFNTGSASASAGQLLLANLANYSGQINTVANYDLTSSSITIEAVALTQPETYFILAANANANGDNVRMQYVGGNLATLWAIGGTQQAGTSIPYDPVAHRWWRIRHNGTNVLTETSPDRNTWTIQGTFTPTISLANLTVFIGAGGGTTGNAIFDNINVVPPLALSVTAGFDGSGGISIGSLTKTQPTSVAATFGGSGSLGTTAIRSTSVTAASDGTGTLTATPTSTPPRSSLVGVSIGAGDLTYKTTAWVDARLDEIVALGAKWLRTDANWSWIEGTQGTFDWYWTDYVVSAANARGLKVLFVAGTIPTWARPAGQPEVYGIVDATARGRFNTFLTALVGRYAPLGVHHYELWNEPNHPPFWTTPNAALYTQMVQSSYPVIKAADPISTVLLGGTAWTSAPGILTASWYTQLYSNGIKGYFDAANMHTYQDPAAATTGSYDTGETALVPTIRATMNANGDNNKPIWATEYGAPTGGTNSVTQTVQRDMMAAGRTLFRNREAGPIFIYSMRDRQDVGATTEREDYFGITTTTAARKLAYTEWASWIGTGFTSSAAFTGSGQLTTTALAARLVGAALSGSGSLTTTTLAARVAAATLSGSGQLTTTSTAAFLAAATLSGSGTLVAGAIRSAAVLATLSGSGTLAPVDTEPDFAAAVSLSGAGSLTTTQVLAAALVATLSGSGSLTTTRTPSFTRSAALSGTGQLTTTSVAALLLTAALSGSGALVAGGKPSFATAVSLSGAGSMDAFAVAIRGQLAEFEGTGQLTAGLTDVDLFTAVALSGSGSLTTTQKIAFSRLAALAGSGALSASLKPATGSGASLSGLGDVDAQAALLAVALVSLTGSGSLQTASSGVGRSVAAALSGLGTLVSVIGPISVRPVVSMSGTGTLAATSKVGLRLTAALAGGGTMQANIRPGLRGSTIHFTGLGSLATTRSAGAAREVNETYVWTGSVWAKVSMYAYRNGQYVLTRSKVS